MWVSGVSSVVKECWSLYKTHIIIISSKANCFCHDVAVKNCSHGVKQQSFTHSLGLL